MKSSADVAIFPTSDTHLEYTHKDNGSLNEAIENNSFNLKVYCFTNRQL